MSFFTLMAYWNLTLVSDSRRWKLEWRKWILKSCKFLPAACSDCKLFALSSLSAQLKMYHFWLEDNPLLRGEIDPSSLLFFNSTINNQKTYIKGVNHEFKLSFLKFKIEDPKRLTFSVGFLKKCLFRKFYWFQWKLSRIRGLTKYFFATNVVKH